MKKRAFSTLLLLSMIFALSIGSAFANTGSTITVKVPFDFVVGKQTLPAGEYTIRENSASGPTVNLLIKGAKNNAAVITSTQPVQMQAGRTKAKLEFTHSQGQYFLRRVYIPDAEFGRQIRLRSHSGETAKAASETVTIQN